MSKLNDSIRNFLSGRHYSTLATFNNDGSLHLTPTWYLFENDLFFLTTNPSSSKVNNIIANQETSIIVDTRKLGFERWVSALCVAEIIRDEPAEEIDKKILQRYLTPDGLEDPKVGPVFEAAGGVIIKLTPRSWKSWELKSLDDQFFGGVLGEMPEKWFLPLD
ncbi:MAG: pyridoxamine 5'-phosphate oxidase family protein [Thermodesulfobacteriota bacterium]